jgi:hypothetical protein
MGMVTRDVADWNRPKFNFTKRPRLSFKERAIFYMTSGGSGVLGDGSEGLFGQHEVVAVNLSRIWSGGGFHAKNLRRYLKLAEGPKLCMLTMTKDDLLESAFSKYFYENEGEYEAAKLDSWMPLSFSSYPEEPNMHQIYQAYRTFLCTERSKAWFTTGDHFQTNINIDDLFLQSVEAIPQVVFNTQFVTTDEWMRYTLHSLLKAHKLCKPDVAFWLVGRANPKWMVNVRQVLGKKREIYWVSPRPLFLASKGQRFTAQGTDTPSSLPKLELIDVNYQALKEMVHTYG